MKKKRKHNANLSEFPSHFEKAFGFTIVRLEIEKKNL